MTHKIRSGSKAFYPRTRAKGETASFTTFPEIKADEAKPMNFFGYKVSMLHIIAKDMHDKSVTYGQNIVLPATVVEVPAMKVFGIRAYAKTVKGLKSIADVISEKRDRHLERVFRKGKPKKKDGMKGDGAGKEAKEGEGSTGRKADFGILEKLKDRIFVVSLLVHTQPHLSDFGKKKPDVSEVRLVGPVEKQIDFAKAKFGEELSVNEVFSENSFVDVKAVTKGKGFAGVVKRFGVRTHRPKAKKQRIVGSIGPWNPSTVMWTVARAGQLGYFTRTEYNKWILRISADANFVNPKSGFGNYGNIKNTYMLVVGSIPGPEKRLISMRLPMRKGHTAKYRISNIDFISTKPEAAQKEGIGTAGDELKAVKLREEKKEQKEEKKSVAEEIQAAARGEKEKKEKKK